MYGFISEYGEPLSGNAARSKTAKESAMNNKKVQYAACAAVITAAALTACGMIICRKLFEKKYFTVNN